MHSAELRWAFDEYEYIHLHQVAKVTRIFTKIFYQSFSFADLSINHLSVCNLLVSFHLISVVLVPWSAMLMSVFISLLLPAAGANLATALTSHLRCCVIWSAAVLCGVWWSGVMGYCGGVLWCFE